LESIGAVLLRLGDLVAGQLARGDGVHALDAVGDVAIGDALHFEHMQAAELGDLLEGKRCVVDQPDGGRFGHERGTVHRSCNTCKKKGVLSTPKGHESEPDSHEGEGLYIGAAASIGKCFRLAKRADPSRRAFGPPRDEGRYSTTSTILPM